MNAASRIVAVAAIAATAIVGTAFATGAIVVGPRRGPPAPILRCVYRPGVHVDQNDPGWYDRHCPASDLHTRAP